MTDKKKKHIRETMAKTGMSHAAVVNQMRGSNGRPKSDVEHSPERGARTPAAMTAELREPHVWAVQVGRARGAQIYSGPVPAAFREPDPALTHFAHSEYVRMGISKSEHDALVEAGATALHDTNERAVQQVRIGQPTYELGCSVQCATCRRWLWAGEELEGACICGQKYHVTFEGEPDHQLPLGRRCMDCGCEDMLTEDHERRNPWRPVSAFQAVCRSCWRQSYWDDPEQHVMPMASSRARAILQARRKYGNPEATTVDQYRIAIDGRVFSTNLQGRGVFEHHGAQQTLLVGRSKSTPFGSESEFRRYVEDLLESGDRIPSQTSR